MSQLQIADESVIALLDGLARDLHEFAAPQATFEAVLQFLCSNLCDMSLDRGHNIIEPVIPPTARAAKDVLRFRISRAFYADLTLATKNRYGVTSH